MRTRPYLLLKPEPHFSLNFRNGLQITGVGAGTIQERIRELENA
jgi:hypothetical protein